jgi:hypothetical protein
MATSNRVFVSPGVYTSELDLTFVAQSVGVTTLGLVGETLKGPAFEPLLITSFDEFRTYFGTTSPEKDGNGNPKYELGYVAKSYLEESNQLFVTRVLGLTGYKPDNTFGIRTLGGVTVTSETPNQTTPGTMSKTAVTSSAFFTELSDKLTTTDGITIPDYVSGTTFNAGNWFTIGPVPESATSGLTGTTLSSPIGTNNTKNWYNTYFTQTTPGDDSTINGVYAYLFVYPNAGNTFTVTRFRYPASLNTEYSNVIVAALRSRGRYVGQSLTLEVTNATQVNIVSSTIDTDPLTEFTLTVNGLTGGLTSYECSMDLTSSKYISKVLGNSVFDKSYVDFPLYVHESYPNLVKNLYRQGLIRGLSTTDIYNSDGADFAERWSTALSPTVVSEVRGGKVADLFDVITISDGEASNQQVKVTIANINLDTKEFDLIVRDFNDTDENVVGLEKFSRCSMDPEVPGYIAKKIGTSDGEYELKSKFIMLEMSENAPIDAIPAGFKGFSSNTSFGTNSILGSLMYKTEYFDAGDIVGYEADGSPITTNGDKPRKVSLGLSSQEGFKYDNDLFKYKGLSSEDTSTYAFHLSVNAASITGTTYKTTPYDLEGLNKGKFENITLRKFTFGVYGGFDGWDIYRNVRTNTDQYIFGKNTYVSNWESNGGVFSSTEGTSDYYSYLKGIETFSNPEAVNINVFATPGLNFFDHISLTNQAIDMVEEDRADALYIINSPNVDDAEEVVGMLDDLGYDSNYSATYWPWIQVRDGDNATQLYIPPTGEVLRNVALTDNVSYPWFAVAGYSRGLVKSIKALKKLTLDERDILYKGRINPIATFSDTGTIIWGNKTLQVRESALDRINVRRLLLRARKLISAVAIRLLFEQNDEQVRNEFSRLVNPILEAIKKERGLFDFRVTVSNAPEDIDANTLRGKIYIKPTRSLEFIDLEFVITPTGASFENI